MAWDAANIHVHTIGEDNGFELNLILLFAVIAGFFGLLCPVLLFGMGSPHLPAGLSTVMAAAELPAGLLVAMIVLGEPLGVVEWLGVAIILAGVCLAQVPPCARAACEGMTS